MEKVVGRERERKVQYSSYELKENHEERRIEMKE